MFFVASNRGPGSAVHRSVRAARAPRPGHERSLHRFTCQTAMRNRPRRSSAPRLAVVFPPLRGGFLLPQQSRGGGAPIGASVFQCTPQRGRARPLGEGNAAPLGAPHGVGRPAGSRFRLTARFQQLRWAWPSAGSERIAWSRCAPGRIPEPLGPRACKARRRKRRTPLRFQMPPERPRVSGVGGRYVQENHQSKRQSGPML